MEWKHEKNRRKRSMDTLLKNKDYKEGLLTAVSCLLVFMIAVSINILMGKLPNAWVRFDTTQIGLNSLSPETEAYIRALDTDIALYLICQEGAENATTVTLLHRMEDLSDYVKVELIDPAVRPTFLSERLGDRRVADNDVFVESEKRSKLVDAADYDSTAYYMGEDYILSAIRFAAADTLPTIYCMSGHQEQALSAEMVSSINLNGYQLTSLEPESDIPGEASVLLLLSPKKDLSEAEADTLCSYLERGGSLFLTTNADSKSMENLMGVMDALGVYADSAYVCEDVSGKHVKNLPAYLIPEATVNTETTELLAGIDYAILPLSHSILEKEQHRESLKIYEILRSSEQSYAKRSLSGSMNMEREEGDREGPFTVGAAITEKTAEERSTRIIWIASTIFLDSEVDEASGGENSRLFMNSLEWLADESVPTLHTKVVSTQSLKVKASDIKTWGTLLVGVIPLSFLAAGFWVWMRRKAR